MILAGGISLNELEFVDVASDYSGPMTIAFSTPITGFGPYLTYRHRLSLQGVDATTKLIGEALSVFQVIKDLSGNSITPLSFSVTTSD